MIAYLSLFFFFNIQKINKTKKKKKYPLSYNSFMVIHSGFLKVIFHEEKKKSSFVFPLCLHRRRKMIFVHFVLREKIKKLKIYSNVIKDNICICMKQEFVYFNVHTQVYEFKDRWNVRRCEFLLKEEKTFFSSIFFHYSFISIDRQYV